MIDVYEQVKELLTFDSKDDFYYLQILQRKKENPQLGSNSRVIKNYYVSSLEYLEMRYPEIKALCKQFNARAMIRLNKRSYSKVAFKTMQNLANSMANEEYSFIKKSYDRACGIGHNDKAKKWILDVDNEEVSPLMLTYINYHCEPKSENLLASKVYCILPTKNGYHVITKPFDLRGFKEKYPNIDIHKDNPINLYIP